MSEWEIRVVGARPTRKPESGVRRLLRRAGNARRAVLSRPRTVTAAAVLAFVAFAGTPHVGWDYQCRHPMHGPGTCRSVAWCAYYGVQGRRIKTPADGEQCRLVTLLPPDWEKLASHLRSGGS